MESTSRDQILSEAVCVYFVLLPLGKAVIHLPHPKQTGVPSLEGGEQFWNQNSGKKQQENHFTTFSKNWKCIVWR